MPSFFLPQKCTKIDVFAIFKLDLLVNKFEYGTTDTTNEKLKPFRKIFPSQLRLWLRLWGWFEEMELFPIFVTLISMR